jgi:flagellar biosynthesis protein FliP
MTARCRFVRVLLVALVVGAASSSSAAKATQAATTAATPASSPNEIRITMPGTQGAGSLSWSIVALLTFLTLIPSLLLCMTPFARLLIVFHFLSSAITSLSIRVTFAILCRIFRKRSYLASDNGK